MDGRVLRSSLVLLEGVNSAKVEGLFTEFEVRVRLGRKVSVSVPLGRWHPQGHEAELEKMVGVLVGYVILEVEGSLWRYSFGKDLMRKERGKVQYVFPGHPQRLNQSSRRRRGK